MRSGEPGELTGSCPTSWKIGSLTAVFERFGDEARLAVVLAEEESTAVGHSCIHSEDLLRGIWRSDGAGADTLRSLPVSLDAARRIVAGWEPEVEYVAPRRYCGFDSETFRAVHAALEAVRRVCVEWVQTEHLLGPLTATAASGSVRLFEALGVDPNLVQARVLRLLNAGSRPTTPGAT